MKSNLISVSGLALIIVLCHHFVIAEISKNSTFVPNKEWQEIREGQGIPAGLHIRINLETGKKEAKLLDDSDQESSKEQKGALATLPENISETPTPPTPKAKHNLKISKTLSDALQNLPKDGLQLEYSPEKLEKIKREYKSLKELKETYDDLRKSFKTDAQIISQLIGEYRNLSKVDAESPHTPQTKINAQLRILEDFNYLVHQFDNALWFIGDGGLEQVILPLVVNQTNINLRVKAMRVLGALTQNNPKAQIKVFERNFGSHLSQILITSTNTEELSTALYAFGSLLREFPHAQLRILSTSGTQALIAVLTKECELKIKAKAATLISDLIMEKQFHLSAKVSDPLAAAQYAELNFAEWLQTNSFCETLDSLISAKLYELLDLPDVMEYLTVALDHTQSLCTSLWSQSPQLRHTLFTVRNRYVHSQDEYRSEVAQQIAKLVATLYPVDEAGAPHDEL